jgi:DNA transformation protein and related proteins
MFSCAGRFAEGVMFALRIRDDIFLKADAETIPSLQSEGSRPFSYETKKRRVVVNSLWRLPDRLLDDPEDLANFARAALQAAHRAAAEDRKKETLTGKALGNPRFGFLGRRLADHAVAARALGRIEA